jgi:hypothetical protein
MGNVYLLTSQCSRRFGAVNALLLLLSTAVFHEIKRLAAFIFSWGKNDWDNDDIHVFATRCVAPLEKNSQTGRDPKTKIQLQLVHYFFQILKEKIFCLIF